VNRAALKCIALYVLLTQPKYSLVALDFSL